MKKSEVFKKYLTCVDDSVKGLTVNKKYEVVGYGDYFGQRKELFVIVINDHSRKESYYIRRFK